MALSRHKNNPPNDKLVYSWASRWILGGCWWNLLDMSLHLDSFSLALDWGPLEPSAARLLRKQDDITVVAAWVTWWRQHL